MKRSILTTVILFAVFAYASAQKEFSDNLKVVSVGAAFGSPYWGKYLKAALPFSPTLSVEKGFLEGVSAGTTISFSNAKYKSGYYSDLRFNAIYIAARATYHFSTPNDKVDLYAGASLGYAVVFLSEKGGGAAGLGSGVAYSVFGGSRYYFAKKTAVYAELGYGSFSLANVGISIRSR